MTSYRRILVPVDCSTPSDRGLEEAIALARLTGARLRLVHVVDEFAYVDGFESAMNYLNKIIPLMRDAGQDDLTPEGPLVRYLVAQGHTVFMMSWTNPNGTDRDLGKSVYKIHRLARAPVSFVLNSGGHNVGIVNPPGGPAAHPQASYRFATHAPGMAPASPQGWLDAAAQRAGSWWPCWHDWLSQHSSGKAKPPRVCGLLFDEGKPLAASGSYVHLG